MTDVELDYEYLTQSALRKVIFDVLSITAELGAAPGEHHFYIEFATGAEGVTIPGHLIATYPERMTIVLQHQFEDLIVGDESFSVSLWFKGKQADLTIPYDAVTSFADPSVQFGMRFDAEAPNAEGESDPSANTSNLQGNETDPEEPPAADNKNEDTAQSDQGADVVELDAFRKK